MTAISIFREYFPGMEWEIKELQDDLLSNISTVVLKTYRDNQPYGIAIQITGSRPIKWTWGWKETKDFPWEDYLDIPEPPQRNGMPGELVTVGVEVGATYIWDQIPCEWEDFDWTNNEPILRKLAENAQIQFSGIPHN